MHFEIIKQGDAINSTFTIRTTNGAESLEWMASEFNKKHFLPDAELFLHLNQYLATLPQHVHDNIWHRYQNMYRILDNVSDATALIRELSPQVRAMYEELDLEHMEFWITYHAKIKIPDRYEELYVPSNDGKPISREKTYIKSDYRKLITMALALRLMVPIWSEFLSTTKRDLGTEHKETSAFALLAKSKLADCPAMMRLKEYISHNIKPDQPMTPSIINGIGRDQYDVWLLGAMVVNRICVGDIRGLDHVPCLVITSWKYISQTTRVTSGSTYNTRIGAKIFSDGADEQEVARLESYKVRDEYAEGEIAPYNVWLEDIDRLVRRANPNLNMEMVREIYESNQCLMSESIQQCQITVMQWVLGRIIAPRAFDFTDKNPTLVALSVAQAVLWEAGHKKLACFLSAICLRSATGHADDEVFISSFGSMARLTKEQVAALEKLYPLQRLPRSKPNQKVTNDGIAAIDIVADGFSVSDWRITLPERFISEAFLYKPMRRQGCPHEIKQMLADLAIQVGQRTLTSNIQPRKIA